MNLDNSFVLQNFRLFHEGSSEMDKRGTMLRLTKNITDLEGPDFFPKGEALERQLQP